MKTRRLVIALLCLLASRIGRLWCQLGPPEVQPRMTAYLNKGLVISAAMRCCE
jgi:hypothetical protein